MNLIKTDKPRFLAIDANAIVHRAFHAYPSSLRTNDGLQVNAVYGFTGMLLSALETFDPKYVLCCFDTNKPTFRHVEFPDYKGTRKPTDQSLIDQFPMVEEVLGAFNIPILKKEGYEADDILGTIANITKNGKWSGENLDLYILSGDRDLLQLVGDNVKVCLPSGNFKNLVVYDRDETFKYMGIYPEQIVDFKAIAGDSSDNIPGIKGIGIKTTIGLLGKYSTLNNIYKHLDEIKPRQADLFKEGVEQAEMSRMLAQICEDVDINVYLDDCVLKDFAKVDVVNLFKKYGFKSLIKKIDNFESNDGAVNTNQLDIFSEPMTMPDLVGESEANALLASSKSAIVAYIGNEESTTNINYFFIRGIDSEGVEKDLVCACDDYSLAISCDAIFYNLENCINAVNINEKCNIFDIGLFAHLIGSERRGYSLRDLSFDYSDIVLNEKISPMEVKKVLDSVFRIKEEEINKANGIELYDYVKKYLKGFLDIDDNYFENVQKKIEIPICNILGKMEKRGIVLNVEHLERLKMKLVNDISSLKKDIFDSIGHEFNINSTKQLADVLFNELQLPSGKKVSTRESVLVSLKDAHPCVSYILEYRLINKMLTTYVEPLLTIAKSCDDHVVHTDFKQTGTTSGRLSSINPNLQNIPMQGDWATKIRKAFVARDGFRFLGIDYSQMELRIMADMSNDTLLIKDFKDGIDVHTSTAARVLNKDIEDITKKERSLGKTVNFAVLFGQSAYGLANLLDIDPNIASEYIQNYFKHYIGVENYIRSLEQEACAKGYVQSMFGTTRHIDGLKSKNFKVRKASQREAVNMPIQGTEADIMKLAMIELDNLIEKEFNGDAFILLQIHDELLFEVKESRLKEFEKKASGVMTKVVCLEVPLSVSSNSGDNMAEVKG